MSRWLEVSKHVASHAAQLETLIGELQSSIVKNEHVASEIKTDVIRDVMIISHYLRCKLTPVEKAFEPISLDGFPPQSVASQSRYQAIIKSLFEKDFPQTTDAERPNKKMVICKNFAEFSEKVVLFERMVRLLPAKTSVASSEVAPPVKSDLGFVIKDFFESLMNWFRRALKLPVKPDDKGYLETADRIWRITQCFDLHVENREEEQTALIAWYKQASDYYAGRPFFHERRLKDSGVWRMDVMGKLSSSSMIASVAEKLQEDLDDIGKWNQYEARAALMAFLLQQEQRTDKLELTESLGCTYVAIYNKMEARIQKWSQDAWRIRQHYEKVLRGEKDYVVLVGKLDKALLELRTASYRKKTDWRAGIEQLFNNHFFSRANDCFAAISSLERKAFYERQYHHVFLLLKTMEPPISDEALHEEMMTRLKSSEYEHLRDLVPVRAVEASRDVSVASQSVFRPERLVTQGQVGNEYRHYSPKESSAQ